MELLYAVSVHGDTGAPVPQIAAVRAERARSLDLDIPGEEHEGVAAFRGRKPATLVHSPGSAAGSSPA
jgi:hypothetical protein